VGKKTRNILFGVLALVLLVVLVILRQTETIPTPGNTYPPVTQSTPAETVSVSPLAILSAAATQTTTTKSSVGDYAKELVCKFFEESHHDKFTVISVTDVSEWFQGEGVWGVFGLFTGGSTALHFHTTVEKQKNGDWWLLDFSWGSSATPTSSETLGTTPRTTSSPSATQTTITKSDAIGHAKVLVWKYLGEPRYDVLNISLATNTIADVWDVSGRFADVGGPTRTFDAIIEKEPTGDWSLLAFSWT
jgi:hypothetical protein